MQAKQKDHEGQALNSTRYRREGGDVCVITKYS